jgi:hypothetical protein
VNFIERVKQKAAATPTESPFRAVAEQFVTGLEAIGLGAALTDRPVGGVYLSLFPCHRPSRGGPVLRFTFLPDAVVVRGEADVTLTTPDAFEEWLLKYMESPGFLENRDLFLSLAALPAEASLRSHGSYTLVAVGPDDQAHLDGLKPAHRWPSPSREFNSPGTARSGTILTCSRAAASSSP